MLKSKLFRQYLSLMPIFLYMTVCEVSILKSLNHPLLFMQSMTTIDAALSRYINESNARGAVS
jgi:hypothetical protein